MQWKKEKSIKFSNEVGDCLLAQMIKKKPKSLFQSKSIFSPELLWDRQKSWNIKNN